MRVRIGSMNLEGGGVDDGNDRRWRAAVDFLQAQELGALMLQEAKWLDRDNSRLMRTARALGMVARPTSMQGIGDTGHRLVTFYHPDVFVPLAETERGAPFWHARLSLPVQPKHMPDATPLKLVHRHGPPFDPVQRLGEVHYDVGFAGKPALLGGDWNCIPPGDPDLVWDGWQNWQPPKRRELEYQALKDRLGNFVLKDGKPMADRRPAEMLIRNGLLDVGAELDDRRPTAGLDGSKTGPRRIDRFHADTSLFEQGIIVGYDYLGDPEHALTFTDHAPIYTELDLQRFPLNGAAASNF